MENKVQPGAQGSSGVVLGVLLIIAGFVYVAARFAPIDLGQNAWPLYVVLPGLALIVLSATSRTLEGLAVIGSIVLMTGLILSVQNAFAVWAAWSYAWALVFPGAVGMGIAIVGAERRDPERIRRGLWMFATGITIATIFGVFFEGLLHVSGVELAAPFGVIFPLLLIAFGIAVLAAGLLDRRHRTS